jgi:hypothetical protein
MNSQVQSTKNIIKTIEILGSPRDHYSRQSRIDVVDDSREVFVHVHLIPLPRAEVVAS